MKNLLLMKKRILAICIATAVLLATATVVFAWYYESSGVDVSKINGAITYLAKYFESGDGTSALKAEYDDEGNIVNEVGCAYEIAKPEQLYNLAWLQYMGYFNRPDKEGEDSIPTTYFYLSADLDMSGFVLPPIGTEDFPFIGNFDGNGHTISNLNVTNTAKGTDTPIQDLPLAITIDGITEVSGVDIIGVFGVVGTMNDNGTANGYSYESQTNEIKNLKLDKTIVSSQTSKTLIGIAAGYVNANLENVSVSDSDIKIKSGITSVDAVNLTTNLSDYSLVGYCTEPYLDTVDVVNVEIAEPVIQDDEYDAPRDGNNWGGSIDMKTMFTRLQSILGKATRKTNYVYKKTNNVDLQGNITTQNSTAEFKTYRSDVAGSYVFGARESNNYSSQYTYLSGGTRVVTNRTELEEQTVSVYRISYNGNYLTLNAAKNGITSTTTAAEASAWVIENNYVYTPVGDVKYYLSRSGNTTLTITTAPQSTWTKNSNQLYFTDWRTKYYLKYTSSKWAPATGNSGSDLIFQTTKVFNPVIKEDESAFYIDYSGTNVTYFPLNAATSGDYGVKTENTGYVISGSYDTTTSVTYPYGTGDIRVSYYSRSDSLNSTTNIRTINASGTKLFTNATADTYQFKKFANSYNEFSQLLTQSNIYGLHFMNSQISTENLVKASSVLINGETYKDYELPVDCIDFTLKTKGYINFFAGTYFSGNNSFFSLHRIIRYKEGELDSEGKNHTSNEIKQILEIKKIYKNSDGKYVYLCSDNNYYSTTYYPQEQKYESLSFDKIDNVNISSLTLMFDLDWIGRQTLTTKSLYYFEIPADAGEFALGSVQGGTGAYLLYLDISANAQMVENTTVEEKEITTASTYERPKGIDFAPADSIENASATMALPVGTNGTINYKRDGSQITVSGITSGSAASSFIEDGITVSPTLVASPRKQTVLRNWRKTVNEVNTTTEVVNKTIFTASSVDVKENGSWTYGDVKTTSAATVSDEDAEAKVYDDSTKNIKINMPLESRSISIDSLLTDYYYTYPGESIYDADGNYANDVFESTLLTVKPSSNTYEANLNIDVCYKDGIIIKARKTGNYINIKRGTNNTTVTLPLYYGGITPDNEYRRISIEGGDLTKDEHIVIVDKEAELKITYLCQGMLLDKKPVKVSSIKSKNVNDYAVDNTGEEAESWEADEIEKEKENPTEDEISEEADVSEDTDIPEETDVPEDTNVPEDSIIPEGTDVPEDDLQEKEQDNSNESDENVDNPLITDEEAILDELNNDNA